MRCVWCDIDLPVRWGKRADAPGDALCKDCARDPFLRMHSITAASLKEAEDAKEGSDGPVEDL